MTGREQRKPTFLVVGAQKAGTTWLFECLNEHPEVFVAPQKEVHYFCRPEDCRSSRREQGQQWYEGLFPEGGTYRAIGEISPDYMYHPYVAEALHEFNPDLRLVFILRHPVERAYSAYWMQRKYRPQLPPFEQALEQRPDYVERGLYHRQIERFRRYFPDEQLRIYIYEEIVSDPAAFFEDLFAFLGADPGFRPASMQRRIADSRQLSAPAAYLVYKIASPIIALPFVTPLWRGLRRRTRIKELALAGLSVGSRSASTASGYEPIPAQVRRRLLARFEQENRRLFALIGREIPQWGR